MGKIIRKGAVLAACIVIFAVFCGFKVSELSSLREFSSPYLGEYECTEALLGGKDILKMFKTVTLTLEKEGRFTIVAKSKAGVRSEKSGTYAYEEETSELVFRAERKGKTYEKRAKLENGSFTVSQSLSGRELVLRFRAKT